MTVLELFTQLSRASFMGLALITGAGFLEKRDPVSRDIFLTFLCLTVGFWFDIFTAISGIEIPVRTLISQCCVVAQPFLMIRLVRYFRPVPSLLYAASMVGMVASWIMLVFVGLNQGPLATVIIIGYFVVIDGYAVLAFVYGTYNSAGVVRQRLRFAAAGSLLLITILVMAGINAVVPAARAFTLPLIQLGSIGSAISYYLGFAPPRWLRQAWQHTELRRYLQTLDETEERTLQGIADSLEASIRRGVGANVTLVQVALRDPQTGVLVTQTADQRLAAAEKSSLEGIVRTAWETQSPQVIRQTKGLFPVRTAAAGTDDSDTLLIIPLATRKQSFGLMIAGLQYGSLFVDEDLALLQLFTQQAAIALQNQWMIEALSERNENLEQKVKARTVDLQRSNQELKMFAYVASHDLQEPLRTISSYLQLIGSRYADKLDSDGHEFIAFAVDGAARMKDLIQDVLAYSRVETEAKDFTDFSAQEAVDEVCRLLEKAVNEAQAIITSDPLPTLTADRRLIVQLFQNLISNAIKYRGERKPEVHIGCRRENGDWHFSVKDNGIGIEPQYREQIFVVFKRLHHREAYSGTGIGLAICKKAVELHDGRIWVESTAGGGSTFHFTIPVEPVDD